MQVLSLWSTKLEKKQNQVNHLFSVKKNVHTPHRYSNLTNKLVTSKLISSNSYQSWTNWSQIFFYQNNSTKHWFLVWTGVNYTGDWWKIPAQKGFLKDTILPWIFWFKYNACLINSKKSLSCVYNTSYSKQQLHEI